MPNVNSADRISLTNPNFMQQASYLINKEESNSEQENVDTEHVACLNTDTQYLLQAQQIFYDCLQNISGNAILELHGVFFYNFVTTSTQMVGRVITVNNTTRSF